MRVAFVHHHFRPGGVTRVISGQASALRGSASVLLVSGEPPQKPPGIPHVVVPSLAYDRDRRERKSAPEIANDILCSVQGVWKNGADLYHFHNPTLGKNTNLLSVIKQLHDRKQTLLLQIHDFAEDGRPWGYTREEYPADCHYAVINKRDYRILLDAGLNKEGLHYIPNTVYPLPHEGIKKQKQKEHKAAARETDVVLYPVRAIRRKNIGEAVLLSRFLERGKKIGITLEPTGPVDVMSYRMWMNFVKEKKLPVLFGLGVRNDFESLLERTSCMITTSIKEGFGLSFLEPWTGGKMLYGRLLRDICSDFMERGVDLGHLYEEIRVPLSLMEVDHFHRLWVRCYTERLNQYGLTDSTEDAEVHFQRIIQNETADFGMLDETLQMNLIGALWSDGEAEKKILDVNPILADTFLFTQSPSLVSRNKGIIEREYSWRRTKTTLSRVYEQVLGHPVFQSVNKGALLQAFNKPEKSFLLLCESACGEAAARVRT